MEGKGRIYEYFLLTNPPLLAPEVLRGGSGRGPKSGFVSTFTHFFCFGAPNPTFCTHKNCTIGIHFLIFSEIFSLIFRLVLEQPDRSVPIPSEEKTPFNGVSSSLE